MDGLRDYGPDALTRQTYMTTVCHNALAAAGLCSHFPVHAIDFFANRLFIVF